MGLARALYCDQVRNIRQDMTWRSLALVAELFFRYGQSKSHTTYICLRFQAGRGFAACSRMS